MLSRAAEVALLALPRLDPAGPSGRGRAVAELAAASGTPRPFLGKVLQRLVGAGLLRSRKGPGGGFLLGRPAREVSLADVVAALERRDDVAAVFPAPPGPAGPPLAPAREALLRALRETTLADLA